jgi:hypothetical protein
VAVGAHGIQGPSVGAQIHMDNMTAPHRATPERLSALSDGVFAVLITVLVLGLRPPESPTFKELLVLWPVAELRGELPFYCHCLDESPLSHALRQGGELSPAMVQFRAFVFHVAASTVYRLDGCEQIGAAAGCLLCSGLLPSKRDVHLIDLGAC